MVTTRPERRKFRPIPELTPANLERFRALIETAGPEDCWLWQGLTYPNGYPRFCFSMSNYVATRIAYKLEMGCDPGQLQVCHSCDTPACCNPRHFFLGTTLDNMRDCKAKGRSGCGKGERHGSKTHPERYGLNFHAKLTEAQARAIRAAYVDGATSSVLAQRYGITVDTVGKLLRGETWRRVAESDGLGRISDKSRQPHLGTANGSAKLTEDAVREIRRIHQCEGLTFRALGKLFGVSEVSAGLIVKRKTWAHLKD